MQNSAQAPSRIAAAVFLLPLIVLRIAGQADLDHVWILGRELHWECWFKERFGIPCPTCGMTRSLILTLHGHLSQALHSNAAGPFLVVGLGVLAAIMLRPQLIGGSQNAARRIGIYGAVYGWLFGIILIGQWSLKLAT